MYYYLRQEECIACGLCQTKAPNYIDYDDDGIVIFRSFEPMIETDDLAMKDACRSCPVHAICASHSPQ